MKYLEEIPSISDIEESHRLIQSYIHRTPVLTSSHLDEWMDCNLYFKCENFQRIGAFKMRGASNTVARLSEEQKQQGIATHSSGNHAQAVALTAKMSNIPAHIVMPMNAPRIKRSAVEGYGARVYTSGPRIEERENRMTEILERTHSFFIHPYDNYNIIAGQATVSKELYEEVNDLDIIMAPAGGGGLLSGTALWTKLKFPNITVYGAEPELVDDTYRSFYAGSIQPNHRIDTIADGLRTQLSDKTFELIKKHCDDILTCSEDSIKTACRLIWERMKIIVEPSGAVPLACIIDNPNLFKGKKVGLIVSGGNVDLDKLPWQ